MDASGRIPVARDEEERLAALEAFAILDSEAEIEFDRLVRMAAGVFQVPIALVSLVHRDRQFFKAKVGLAVCETSRDVSFCAHAIAGDDVLVVPDAARDARFSENALVTGAPFIRFYAGAPLIAPSGHRVGSFCVIDTTPRPDLSKAERPARRFRRRRHGADGASPDRTRATRGTGPA